MIGVLTGRGGIGKSKLLHDWAGGLGNANVLYVREDAVWHPEAAKEIPSGNVVIIGDDAHRFDLLDNLVTQVRSLKQRQNIKLVLSLRPSGTSHIDAALASRFEPGQIRRFAQLERVRRQSAIALAQENLERDHLQHAPALAAVSADIPLVTVVGGRLIARGDIAPALLANEEDFRHQVFDRFAAEYERLLPAGTADWRKLLNLIAAVGPLVPNAENFLNPAAEILRLRPDEILQAIDRKFLDELVAYLLNNADPYLAQMICIALRRLRHSDPARYHNVGLQAAVHKSPYIGYGTANAVCYGPSLTAPAPADLAILDLLSQHSNLNVRHLAFTGIRRISAHPEYERAAVNLLLRSDVGDDSKMAEEMCGTVDYAGISLAHLSEAEIRTLLQKLVATKDIDGHHIGRFLDWVGQNHPAALCEFTITRLNRYAGMQSRGEATTGYTPVRREPFGNAFHALLGSPQYDGFLIQVRDRFTSQSEQRYWLREIFWAIAAVDTPTLSALDELLHSDDKEKVRAVIDLIGGAPPELALRRPWFAIHMIEECERLEHDLGEGATSVLIANAHAGPFQRAPGHPSPKYLTMKERSAALREIFTGDSIGRRFFSRLFDSAVGALERERLDDEERGFH